MYVVVITNWYSQHALALQISNALDTRFCLSVLETALPYGTPEVFNIDPGDEITARFFETVCCSRGFALTRISLTGERKVKYEDFYLRGSHID